MNMGGREIPFERDKSIDPADVASDDVMVSTALLEQGRRLASERDDLIASGVSPDELEVPIAPVGAAVTLDLDAIEADALAALNPSRCRCTVQSGSVYSSQCPRHDPRDPGYRAPWQMPPATALALVAEVRRLTGVRAECERQFQAQVGLVAAETTRAESAEAEVRRLTEEAATQREWFEAADAAAERRLDQSIAWMERAEAAEADVVTLRAKVAAVEALLTPETTWRCSACGWVATVETIDTALWREADRTVAMVCPECHEEGGFVDHDPLIESLSAQVHEAWMEAKRAGGITSRPSESGEEQMVAYALLSEQAKELDRASVSAVIAPLRAALATTGEGE